MSYILDALRRAEDDRRKANGNPLEQITAAGRTPVGEGRRMAPAVAVILILVGMLLLGSGVWWWHQRLIHPSRVAVTPVPKLIPAGWPATPPTPQPPRGISGPGPSPQPEPPPTPAPSVNPIQGAGRLSSLDDLMPPKPAAAPAKTVPTSPPPQRNDSALLAPEPSHAPAATQQPTPATKGTGAGDDNPISTTPLPTTTSTEIQPAVPQQQSTAASPRDSAQALKAMPDSYRSAFPQITVQVHVYDDDPAKRWTLIDGKRYREGDTLPQGPKIFRIVPQGIVFDWQGQRVLYPVGS